MGAMEDDSGNRAICDSFESFPLTRPEYISAMVHFYRGEMYRSQIWRTRLDTTTNWAVVTVAGMISFAFSSPEHSPLTLLLANVLILNFLLIEARRYRYFSVYRARVRMIEENFYLPLIRRNLVSPKDDWRDRVALDLDTPKFKITYLEALLFRLRQNYVWLFGVVLVTWLVKLFIHPTPASTLAEIFARVGVGPISPWLVLALVATFYAAATLPLFTELARRAAVDEIRGFERELGHWKV
jgi:uncharacterized membrane protein